jgi:translation initiation factor IF-3
LKLGLRLLERLTQELAEDAVVESAPRQDDRNMVMVVAPIKASRP